MQLLAWHAGRHSSEADKQLRNECMPPSPVKDVGLELAEIKSMVRRLLATRQGNGVSAARAGSVSDDRVGSGTSGTATHAKRRQLQRGWWLRVRKGRANGTK